MIMLRCTCITDDFQAQPYLATYFVYKYKLSFLLYVVYILEYLDSSVRLNFDEMQKLLSFHIIFKIMS